MAPDRQTSSGMKRQIGRQAERALTFRTKPKDNHQVCSFMWADKYWILSHKKENAEHMMKELVEEVDTWDMESNTRQLAAEEDLCKRGKARHRVRSGERETHTRPFADEFRILGHLFSRDGRMQISLEERMQSANEAWWSDVKKYRCKSVPWKLAQSI